MCRPAIKISCNPSNLSFGIQYSPLLLFAVLLLSLAACQPTAPETPSLPLSTWGPIITLAQAEQADAPAIWLTNDGLVAAWVGTEAEGPPFQALRRISAVGMTEPANLPLPVRPSAQQIIAAGGSNLHLFWLDANIDNETRLFTALLKQSLERERESTILTKQATRRYNLLPAGDGGVWAIAAGGLVSEPGLFAHFIDSAGRPRFAENYQIAADADWPAGLLGNDGSLTLFWLRNSDSQLMRSPFVDGQLLDPRPISTGVLLNPGDRLEDFSVGHDSARQYVFWNLTRANGNRETWMTTGGSAATNWPDPTRLGINLNPADFTFDAPSTSFFEPGFNTGVTFAASAGSYPLSWAQPITGQFNTLPVALLIADNCLSIVYFRAGEIVGVQPIRVGVLLIGMPNLQVDRDLFLYLAWSRPNPAGYADLQLATLKYGDWPWVKNPRVD